MRLCLSEQSIHIAFYICMVMKRKVNIFNKPSSQPKKAKRSNTIPDKLANNDDSLKTFLFRLVTFFFLSFRPQC